MLAVTLLVIQPARISVAGASDRTTFQGCVESRTDTSITLNTSGGEHVSIDTTWLKREDLDDALTDCVTVIAMTVDGRYIAESIEAGDEQAK